MCGKQGTHCVQYVLEEEAVKITNLFLVSSDGVPVLHSSLVHILAASIVTYKTYKIISSLRLILKLSGFCLMFNMGE